MAIPNIVCSLNLNPIYVLVYVWSDMNKCGKDRSQKTHHSNTRIGVDNGIVNNRLMFLQRNIIGKNGNVKKILHNVYLIFFIYIVKKNRL